jgi:hypothetical protein
VHKNKVIEYSFGLSTVIIGLGFYSYYVRELLASLALFTGAFFLLGLALVGGFLLGWVAVQAFRWTGPASHDLIAFSRRLVAVYVKS